jgi:hypothetical protein
MPKISLDLEVKDTLEPPDGYDHLRPGAKDDLGDEMCEAPSAMDLILVTARKTEESA